MKFKTLVPIFAGFSLMLQSCSTDASVWVWELQEGQKLVNYRGEEAILSKKNNIVVLKTITSSNPVKLGVEVTNKTKSSFDFSEENITVNSDTGGLRVLSKTERQAEIASEARTEMFAAVLAGTLANSYYTNKGMYGAALNNSIDTNRAVTNTADNARFDLRFNDLDYLVKHTLQPNRITAGLVNANGGQNSSEINVSVNTNGEIHRFVFKRIARSENLWTGKITEDVDENNDQDVDENGLPNIDDNNDPNYYAR